MTDSRDNPAVKPIIKINPRKQHNGASVQSATLMISINRGSFSIQESAKP